VLQRLRILVFSEQGTVSEILPGNAERIVCGRCVTCAGGVLVVIGTVKAYASKRSRVNSTLPLGQVVPACGYLAAAVCRQQ
jgi:hypothetical protein